MSDFATPWTAACQASLSFIISWSLLTLMSVESLMPSNDLILCCPLLLLPSIFPSIRVFSNESVLCIRWPKYWSINFSMSFQWIFRVDFLNDWLVWSPCCSRDTQPRNSVVTGTTQDLLPTEVGPLVKRYLVCESMTVILVVVLAEPLSAGKANPYPE